MRFAVAFDPPYPADPFPLVPGGNLITGETELGRVFGPLTGVEADLLLVAAAIFAADLATRRGERERFTRALHLRVPVVNHHAFARVRDDLQYVLHLLSDDNWELEFPRRAGPAGETATWPFAQGQTLLFSGGLDSLAGAVAALEAGVRLQLASH